MQELKDRYIRFDWAIKRLLRQKANFGVLEGFLTVFLNEPIKIVEILESEGNQQEADDKFNRVDILLSYARNRLLYLSSAVLLSTLLFGCVQKDNSMTYSLLSLSYPCLLAR